MKVFLTVQHFVYFIPEYSVLLGLLRSDVVSGIYTVIPKREQYSMTHEFAKF